MSHLLAEYAATGGGMAFPVIFLVIIGIGLASFAFWLWMLIDLLRSSKPTNEKILWALIIIFVYPIGSLIYFLVARGPRSSV